MDKMMKLNAATFGAILLLLVSACDKSENVPVTSVNVSTGPIDADGKFERMLDEVDNLIGKRLKSTQTDTSVGGTYKSDGPIDKVLTIVDVFAKSSGFAAASAPEVPSEALQATGAVTVNKFYKNPMGEMITVTQSGGKFLSILLVRATGMPHSYTD